MLAKIEINLAWLDDNGEIKEKYEDRLVDAMARQLEENYLHEAGEILARKAEALIRAKTEMLVASVMEAPLVIREPFRQDETYPSIYDYIEKQMIALYSGKFSSKNGTCTKDPIVSQIENHVAEKVRAMLSKIESLVKVEASRAAEKSINENKLIQALGVVVDQKGGARVSDQR